MLLLVSRELSDCASKEKTKRAKKTLSKGGVWVFNRPRQTPCCEKTKKAKGRWCGGGGVTWQPPEIQRCSQTHSHARTHQAHQAGWGVWLLAYLVRCTGSGLTSPLLYTSTPPRRHITACPLELLFHWATLKVEKLKKINKQQEQKPWKQQTCARVTLKNPRFISCCNKRKSHLAMLERHQHASEQPERTESKQKPGRCLQDRHAATQTTRPLPCSPPDLQDLHPVCLNLWQANCR